LGSYIYLADGPAGLKIYAFTNPTVSITDIPDFVNSLASISGTASGTALNELEKVQVVLSNTTDSIYWDGSAWVSTETWLDATGTTSWNWLMPALIEGKSYIVKAKSIDKAGNESLVASANFTLSAPLSVEIDVGTIHFRNEIAQFSVLTSLGGERVAATIESAKLYDPQGNLYADLTGTETSIATGIFRITYTIPPNAPVGAYTIVVDVENVTAASQGTALRSFLLSSTLTGMNASITNLEGDIATIQTDVGTIRTDVTDINAQIASIDGNIAAIKTDIGTIKADISNINARVISIEGGVATVETDVGNLTGKVTSIEGNIATVQTDVGTIEADVSSVIAQIETPGVGINLYMVGFGAALLLILLLGFVAAIRR
jgi:archaellum component FlaC